MSLYDLVVLNIFIHYFSFYKLMGNYFLVLLQQNLNLML